MPQSYYKSKYLHVFWEMDVWKIGLEDIWQIVELESYVMFNTIWKYVYLGVSRVGFAMIESRIQLLNVL